MEWSGMALFYFACLAFGFLSALVGVVFGEIGGHGVGHGGFSHAGHELDVGHHAAGGHGFAVEQGESNMPGASIFNAITIATFIGFFGIAGLFAVWGFHLDTLASLAFALPVSIVIAVIEFVLYVKVFVYAQASSEATMSDTLGCEAVVNASIPGDRVGQISYVIKGSRFTAPAASADGEDIPKGSKVRIVNINGVTLVVRPI